MAEQLFGSPGTSLVRSGAGRVARGAWSTTLAVCILWLHLSRESQSVWPMRTSEGSWRKGVKTSTSNPGSGNSTTVTTDGTKQRASLSACIKTQENTYSGGSSRRRTIRIYSCVPAKGDFEKEKREYRVQTVGNAPGVMQKTKQSLRA